MPSPSKNKGNAWERDVAADLSKLYGEHFMRAPGSGAYTGGSNSHRKQILHEGQIRSFKGDIIPGQSFPRLNAECKSYGDFPFHQLFQGEVKQLEAWLEQLVTASDEGDFDILLVKITRKVKLVAVRAGTMDLDGLTAFTYRSTKLGAWVLCEYDAFWTSKASEVKILCGAQVAGS